MLNVGNTITKQCHVYCVSLNYQTKGQKKRIQTTKQKRNYYGIFETFKTLAIMWSRNIHRAEITFSGRPPTVALFPFWTLSWSQWDGNRDKSGIRIVSLVARSDLSQLEIVRDWLCSPSIYLRRHKTREKFLTTSQHNWIQFIQV